MSAVLIVRIPSGAILTFHASEAELSNGLVHATGVWKGKDKTVRSYSWSTKRVLEIRWSK